MSGDKSLKSGWSKIQYFRLTKFSTYMLLLLAHYKWRIPIGGAVMWPSIPECIETSCPRASNKQILLVVEGNTENYSIWKLGQYTKRIAFASSGQYATFQIEYFSVLPPTTNNICLILVKLSYLPIFVDTCSCITDIPKVTYVFTCTHLMNVGTWCKKYGTFWKKICLYSIVNQHTCMWISWNISVFASLFLD